MPTYLRLTGLSLLAAAALTAAACDGPPPKPVVFNDRIAHNNERWNKAVLDFKKAIEPALLGGGLKPADAQAAYDSLVAEFKEVRYASRHMPAPLSSPTGRAFLKKYQEYIGTEEDILNDEIKKIIDTIADPNLNNNQKSSKIWSLYNDVEKHEKDAREAMLGAQSEFASAHKLSITGGGGGSMGPMMPGSGQ